MNSAIEAADLEPVVNRTFGFEVESVHEAYRYVEEGKHQGKAVISVE